jgi:HPt (histidine-containing phosphotransfer) domain-containing protein
MNDAALAGDLVALGREAHALKSSSGTFGAFRLQALSRAIEMACREARTRDAMALLRSVHAMSAEASAALRAHAPVAHAADAMASQT